MSRKAYRGLKSSVYHKKSEAKRMAEQRQKNMQSLSARNIKAKPLKNSVRDQHPPMPNRAVRIAPIKQMATIVRQLPETDLTRKGMSLRQLLMKTPALMKNNSVDVVLETLKEGKTKSGLKAIQAKAYSVDDYRPSKTKRVHQLYIIGMDSQTAPVSKQRRVLVSCSCESYCFTFEYANSFHGASRLIYSNGEPPSFTNPALLPGLCKHLVALADEIRSKGL